MLDWSRNRPVLHAAYRLLDDRPDGAVRDEEVADLLGQDVMQVAASLKLLIATGYVQGYRGSGGRIDSLMPTEKGLQECHGWPSMDSARTDGAEQLAEVLAELEARAISAEERGRARRIREAAAEAGQGMVGEIMGSWLAKMTGA